MNAPRSQRSAGTRRLEVPVLLDARGDAWAPAAIDTTLAVDEVTVLAECPPPTLHPSTIDRAIAAAISTAKAAGPAGAWTVVFSVAGAAGDPCLLSCRRGLPRSYAAVDEACGVDLAALAARIEAHAPLPVDRPAPRGGAAHAVLSARDPWNHLAPRGGVVEILRFPTGAGVRVDREIEEGESIRDRPGTPLLRLTARGGGRSEALARLRGALAQTVIWIRGGATDKELLLAVLDRDEVTDGSADAPWLVELAERGELLPRRGADLALVQAAIAGYESELDRAKASFYSSATRGRPEVPAEAARTVELGYRGERYVARVAKLEARRYRVEIEGRAFEAELSRTTRSGQQLTVGARAARTFVMRDGGHLLIEVDGLPHRVALDEGGVVRAPGPAVVVSIEVEPGDEVRPGDRLAVLEAMKMETVLLAESAGRVRKVLVRRNAQVAAQAPLLLLDASAAAPPPAVAPGSRRVAFDALASPAPSAGTADDLDEARRLLLGYDVESRGLVASLAAGRRAGAAMPRLELQPLRAWVDLVSLFRRRAGGQLAAEVDDDGRRSVEEHLFTYLRDLDARGKGLPASFLAKLERALTHFGIESLDPSPELAEALFRLAVAQRRSAQGATVVLALLERWLVHGAPEDNEETRALLDRLIAESRDREPAVFDSARELSYRLFDRPLLLAERERLLARAGADLATLASADDGHHGAARRALVECPQSLHAWLALRLADASPRLRAEMLEVMLRRFYRVRPLGEVLTSVGPPSESATADYDHRIGRIHVVATHGPAADLRGSLDRALILAEQATARGLQIVVDLFLWGEPTTADDDALAAAIATWLDEHRLPTDLWRLAVSFASPGHSRLFTFRRNENGKLAEDRPSRGLHPMIAERLQVWRLRNFALEQLESSSEVRLFRGVAHRNPKDERFFALAEVRDMTALRDARGRVVALPQLERAYHEALAGIRRAQSRRSASQRLPWNRVLLYLWPATLMRRDDLRAIVHRLAPFAAGLGLEKVVVQFRAPGAAAEAPADWVLEVQRPGEGDQVVRFRRPSVEPLAPLGEYAQKVVELKRRGVPYAYEVLRLLAPPAEEASSGIPPGKFVEHDLDASGDLVAVERPAGGNTANVVVGVIRSFTARYPEGMARVIVLGDGSRGLGALAEPECRRINAALDLAQRMGVPLEWVALSAGAKIAMDSGTENMDWIALTLRRLIEFTQGGGEVNILVPGINVGAQPYWNAEATMLMHTRGILVMTPDGAMVLTGKQALDYSGGVSAEDNWGIGGYERIMGPNGQAQYFARDLGEACRILMAHYEHAYVAPGERFPRPAASSDPRDRDVRPFPHGGEFVTVGEIFSDAANPGRKRPFDIRRVMRAVTDQDHEPLERWFAMRDAETGVVWDAHLGGQPVCLLGFESRPLPRLGWVPAYGPDQWTSGTLFPQASRKIARAINAASGSRPLVVVANLSGFDGSPESMRNRQLEYGAEIGRAVVNFKGPIVFVVVSRYHGGAFVVFSGALHDNMQVAALEGSYASVIGGAPAAAVVFAREVDKRTKKDPRVAELEKALADPACPDRAAVRARLAEATEIVRSEKLGEVAAEYDRVHDVSRAQRVGSVHEIIPAARLRPWLIEALERGMARAGEATS